MAMPTMIGKTALNPRSGARQPLDEDVSPSDLEDESESLSPSGQDAPNVKGGKPNPLKLWARSMLERGA